MFGLIWRRKVPGFGTRRRFDLDLGIREQRLLRATTLATLAKFSEGVDLGQRFTWYRAFNRGKRAAWLAAYVHGHTDPGYVESYGLSAVFCRLIWSDWLYLEVEPKALFPRKNDGDFTAAIEIKFDTLYGNYMPIAADAQSSRLRLPAGGAQDFKLLQVAHGGQRITRNQVAK